MRFLNVSMRLSLSPKRRRFYIKLITYTLLLSLLPVIVLSILFYHNATSVMQRELQAANANYLKQTVNALEVVINQVSNSFRQLALDKVIREFEDFPRGTYYETLAGTFMEEDLPGMYTYLDSKKRLSANLGVFKQSNEFIYSVYFYDNSKQLVMTSDGIEYEKEKFYDKGWDQFAESIQAYPSFMDLRSAKQIGGGSREVIPIVYTSPIAGNYMVVNLDAESIYKSFVSKLDNKSDSAFFVLSGTGKLMLYDDSNALNVKIGASDILQRLGTSLPQSFERDYDGKRMLVSYLQSDFLGWTFVTAAALDDLYGSVSSVKGIVFLAAILLALTTVLLALITTRHIYNPIGSLMQFIKSKDQNFQNGANAAHGELHMIRSSLEEAYGDRESLQVRLKESMPANQEIFVRSLLRKHSYTREEIFERMQYFGFDFALDGIMLMVVSLNEAKAAVYGGVEDENLNKLRLVDRIEQLLPPERKRIVLELADGMFLVMLNCEPDEYKNSFMLAELMITHARQKLAISCTIGIGNYCKDIFELKRAFEEAHEALRCSTIVGTGEVIHIEDVRLEGTPLFVYPHDKEAALNKYIANGEAEEAKRVFADIVKDLAAQQGRVHYHQIEHAFMQLLGSLVKTANGLRVDMNKLLERKNNLYSELLQLKGIPAMTEWLDDTVVRMANRIGTAFKEKNNRHVEQITEMVEQEIGEPISLTFAADRLGLNPAYLSRIFKEKTGEAFSEYVTRVRMEHSKRLLVETEMKIKEIGDSVGYHKTNYFIKLFKDYTGMTPGEYRKMLQPDKMAE
ncbi:hypothetical protein DQG23_39435 [Paenibacillus contaminans]|uniref:HTH araC/xylS-type domain-containing protein n=2 Tax=Paenibacillus contaminans TaxID=450362 RepID=A0A329LP86_9BACL|nr:hypothetical protein DQG23_39435 [Paenibacillus contaminans]